MSVAVVRTLMRALCITSVAVQVGPAQSPGATPESTHVTVSRREVRVVFPRDTATAWGFADTRDSVYFPTYVWGITVDGMDGPRTLRARVDQERGEARRWPSLAALVAAARVERCPPGMGGNCSASGMNASVDDDRVVITLRDSAQIARLFGMRPTSVEARLHRPGERLRLVPDTVHVEYVEPMIPEPDAATRDDASRSRRRYEESVNWVQRYLSGGTGNPWKPMWLVVGDSAAVSVTEWECHHDACWGGQMVLDSSWTIRDTRIAELRPMRSDSSNGEEIIVIGNTTRYVKALRPGRTVLRVDGVHGVSDTAASSKPPARTLERAIVVTAPMKRIEITPRPETVRGREIVTYRVRAWDRTGQEFTDLPWRLEIFDGDYHSSREGPDPASLVFATPRRVRLVAHLGALTDTLTISVIATPPSR